LAAEVNRQVTPLDSAQVSDYVNRIAGRLSAQIQPNPFSFTIQLTVDDRSNSTHEPLALPGGYIFIPASLIVAANDEAEFAGMLAHSMAHATARHYTRQATRGAIAEQATAPLILMGGWTGYGTRQASTIVPVGFLKFERENEIEADRMAVTT